MNIKVLHIVGGLSDNGAFQGANILHEALIKSKIKSKILSDMPISKKLNNLEKKEVVFINENFFNRFLNKIFVFIEKLFKGIFLH